MIVEKKKLYTAEIVLICIPLLWGGTFVFIKNALQDFSPNLFVAIRFLLALIIILPFTYKALFNQTKIGYRDATILGLLFFAAYSTQTIGLEYTSVTKSAFITSLFVVLVPIFQTVIKKRAPGLGSVVAVIFVFIGIIFLTSKGVSLLTIFTEIGSDFNFGDFMTLLCAIFYSLQMIHLDMISDKYDVKFLALMQIGITALMSLFVAFSFDLTGIEKIQINFTDNVIFAFFYTAIFASVLTTFMQTKYQRFVTPTRAGIYFSMEPIYAALIAFILMNEIIPSFGLIGCLLIFIGVIISEVWRK